MKNTPRNTPEKAPSIPTAAALGLIVLTCVFIYIGSIRGPFVFDDYHTIVDNPYITSLKSLPDLFFVTSEGAGRLEHEGWRPLWFASFALNYMLGGLDTFGYHAVNVALHAGCSVLVYLLTVQLLAGRAVNKKLAGLLAGLFFAANPVQTESVSYIVSRSASMAAFFYLLSFYFYLLWRERGKKGFFAFSAVSFCLSMLTKEHAVTLPLMVVAYEYAVRGRGEKKPFGRFALLFVLAGLYAAARFYIAGLHPAPVAPRGPFGHWLTEAYVFPFYVLKSLLPFNLNIDPDIGQVTSIADPRFLLSVPVLAGLFYGLYRLWRADRLAGFLGLWFFVAFMPETVMPITDFMAEHRAYLPLAGMAILFGFFLEKLLNGGRISGPSAAAAWALTAVLFASLSSSAWARDSLYASESALWSDTVRKSPMKARGYVSLALALINEGKDGDPEALMRKAVELDPDYAEAHFNLSLLYKRQGRFDDALAENLRALQIAPDHYYYTGALAALYEEMGMYGDAEAAYKKDIEIQPDFSRARYSLGMFYIKRKKYADAIEQLKAAVALEPHYIENHTALGGAYLLSGEYGPALAEYGEALKIAPANPPALYNMALALDKAGDRNRAAGYYRRYVSLAPASDPDRATAVRRLEALLHQ